jgi:L-iduronidase
MRIQVDVRRSRGPFVHFWRSTGFTPAELLLNPDMQQTLGYVGAVAHGGVRWVRIHFLLDLLKVEAPFSPRPRYDWSRLDLGLDALARNGLAPFFELMGTPSPEFNNFLEDRQTRAWKRLVRDLALHYQDRYGRKEVESWRFETWNEPDVGWWKQGEEAFCRYYDACSEGLREANPRLRLGGPGTAKTFSSILKVFLAHCDKGRNYFTGKRGARLDFLSVHEKGAWACKEEVGFDTLGLTRREEELAAYVRRRHPRLAGVPLSNNECDPIVGWNDIHTWHGRPFYAAQICRSIDLHLRRLLDAGIPYELLGNDNGFLGGWGQRTQLARLGREAELARGEFELIKKPALNVMSALALLGDTRLDCEVPGRQEAQELGALATRRGAAQLAILVYHSRDRVMSCGRERISLELANLPFREAMLAHYRIDEEHGDPFRVWERLRSRQGLGPEQYAELRRRQELSLFEEPRSISVSDGRLVLDFDLPLHAVSLVLLTRRTAQAPPRPDGLRAERYRGLNGARNTLLLWEDCGSRALRTYEVLYSRRPRGGFRRINEVDLLDTGFLVPDAAAGCYRVRAVDYWGRAGAPSAVLRLE